MRERIKILGIEIGCMIVLAIYNMARTNSFAQTAEILIVIEVIAIICTYLIDKVVLRKMEMLVNENQEKALIDAMTGIHNKRSYYSKIDYFNSCDSIGVIFLDMNNLKKINDEFGHKAGDESIITLANVIKKFIAYNVYAYRFGGDEFVIIVVNITKQQLNDLKENFVNSSKEVKLKFSEYPISIAIGTDYSDYEIDVDLCIKHADASMYEDKLATKNLIK